MPRCCRGASPGAARPTRELPAFERFVRTGFAAPRLTIGLAGTSRPATPPPGRPARLPAGCWRPPTRHRQWVSLFREVRRLPLDGCECDGAAYIDSDAMFRSGAGIIRAARAGDGGARAELTFCRHATGAWQAAWSVASATTSRTRRRRRRCSARSTRLDTFDESRPFAPWLYRVVVNVAVRAAERESRAARVVVPDRAGHPAEAADLDPVRAAVLALPDDHREIVALRYWADLGVEEIATVLDVPSGTVASHSRAHWPRSAATSNGTPVTQIEQQLRTSPAAPVPPPPGSRSLGVARRAAGVREVERKGPCCGRTDRRAEALADAVRWGVALRRPEAAVPVAGGHGGDGNEEPSRRRVASRREDPRRRVSKAHCARTWATRVSRRRSSTAASARSQTRETAKLPRYSSSRTAPPVSPLSAVSTAHCPLTIAASSR